MSSSTVNTLSATDRKQLCKITEGRFEMLREQLSARWNEVSTAVRDQVMAEHDSDIKAIRKALRANTQKSDKLEEDHSRKQKEIAREREDIVAKASDLGLKVTNDRYSSAKGIYVTDVTPKNVDKAVAERAAEYQKSYKEARTGLRTTELGVLENISVAGLQSEQAKDLLGEIPSIDNLLPPPETVLELQS